MFWKPLLACALLPSLLLAQDLTPVAVKNANFAEADPEGMPKGWKAYPSPNGDSSTIKVDPSGGVRITDNDAAAGAGLTQWIPARPGAKYTATLDLAGTGGLFLYLTFVPSIPTKDGDVGKVKLGEQRVWFSAGKPAELAITAPAGSKYARLWLYSAKDGKADVVIKSVTCKSAGGSDAPLADVPATPAVKVSPPASPDTIIQPGAIQVVDFETGDFQQTRTLEGGKKEVVSAPEPVRAGKYAMKVSMTHNQKRSELTSLRSSAYGEFKYGWSIYIPKDFDGKSSFSIVTQWHDWGTGREYAQDGGAPTHLYIAGDNWRFKLRYQDGETGKTAKQEFALGSIEADRGKWTDFAMEVNWQSPKSGGGYLRLYKNGEKIIDHSGPTWYEEKSSGPFFKMGMYKGAGSWKGEESQSVLYFDEFRMGDKTVALKDVTPK